MSNNNLKQQHQPGTILNQNYRLQEVLGTGGSGITYTAQNLETNKLVAIKILSFHHLQDWKQLELFEREAQVLANLNHFHIPNYIEYFAVEDSFCIVQELAPGKSLAQLVSSGKHFTEAKVRDITTQILKTLVYLHSQQPPVIHRDIKPENIILDSAGKVFLVDFGAVQNTYHSTLARGSTVVGTFGYMAPEQFMGQAVPATDLYGLGATLLFLLTHRSPAELPTEELKIDVSGCTQVSDDLTEWLEKMVEPDVADRFRSAKQALARLRKKSKLASNSKTKWKSLVTLAVTTVAASWGIVQLPFYLTVKWGLFPQGVHRSVKEGDIEELEKYLEAGVDPDLVVVASRGTTLLHESVQLNIVVWRNNPEVVKLLIANGANVNTFATNGRTPLHSAVENIDQDMVKLLIANGANVHAVDNDGYTPLHSVVWGNNQDMVKLLIANGADVHAVDNDGKTPLHRAVRGGANKEMVKLLIANGANVHAVDQNGHIPLHYAAREGNQEIIKLLKSHGAKK